MINKKLIQYCKDNDFPIEEMNDKDFKVIENTFEYKRYLLACKLIELNREVAKPLYKLLNYMTDKINDLFK